ncbi:MAG: PAS domain-containing sensor histidine kinase, partial [Magnetospirillum sp.]|nr:PAS domain-containing sensor histidine kinase [Magnetospirillum sp.]
MAGVLGAGVCVGLWILLEFTHNHALSGLVDRILVERLEQKSKRDSLRIEALLRAHHTLVALTGRLAAIEPLAGAVQPPSALVVSPGAPDWFPAPDERQGFPPLDFLVLLDGAGTPRKVWLMGRRVLPPEFAAALAAMPRGQTQTMMMLGETSALVSVSAPRSGGGERFVAASLVTSDFLAASLGGFLDRGFSLILYDGRILASAGASAPAEGTRWADLDSHYRVPIKGIFGDSGLAFSSLLSRDDQNILNEPLITLERRSRTIMGGGLSALFLMILLYIVWRVRQSSARVGFMTRQIFDAAANPRSGDELRDLEAEVETLVSEVRNSREALKQEEATRLNMITAQLALETENERLQLLQSVTEVMGVGVIRITATGPKAENSVMQEFSRMAGGLEPFIQARTRGDDEVRIGEGEAIRIFETILARSVDYGLILVEDVTDRRRAEADIAIYAQFPSQNPHPVLRVDLDGKVTHSNQPAERVLEHWGILEGDRLPEDWHEHVRDALRTGARRELELTIRDRILSMILVPLPAAGVVNIYGGDITGRVAAERMLNMVNESLERRVHQRTEALKAEIAEHI